MSLKCSKQELLLVVMAVAVGAMLRFSQSDGMAVEHFDEGIYSSTTWYDAATGHPWPMRHLYAPPLLPQTIGLLSEIPGLYNLAPFLPSLVLGSLSALAMWWMARTMFGQTAGLFMVFVAAFSDFHILFSRMALTDVPVLFWMSLAVTLALRGIAANSMRLMAVAGFCCGISWWTKYTGWLPLAIVGSGSAAWWILKGRKEMSCSGLAKMLCVMAGVAIITWLPWLWMLQDVGGYKAVAENHAGYFKGLTGWQSRLASHMVFHFRFDSWLSAGSLGIGLLAAGTRRWIELKRSTWNRKTLVSVGKNSAAENSVSGSTDFPSPNVLARFVTAAMVMSVLGSGIGAAGLLTCISIGGLAGMFLSPVLSGPYHHSRKAFGGTGVANDLSEADRTASAAIDPSLSACIALAWFSGMLLMTPMYHAYPRLSLPLLTGIWLAASGGIAWWIESTLDVDRRGDVAVFSRRTVFLKRAVTGLVMGAIALTFMQSGGPTQPLIWQRRTSLRDASWTIADTVLKHVGGEFVVKTIPLVTDADGLITPEPEWEQKDENGDPLPEPTEFGQVLDLIVSKFDTSQTLAKSENVTCVIYGFGEPSVLNHLHSAGLTVAPVQDVGFAAATLGQKTLPTYLVLGPYALRTPGFMNDWAIQQERFEHITDTWFFVSDVVLYNLFAPAWIAQHPECQVQKLELYRLKSSIQKQETHISGD